MLRALFDACRVLFVHESCEGYAGAALRSTRALRTLAWGAVAVGVATPLVRHRLRLRPAGGVGAVMAGPRRARARRSPHTRCATPGIYALQMWVYFAHFDMPDDDPDALLRRLKVEYPIRCDRVIGLRDAARPPASSARSGARATCGALDYALSAVHWSWFLVPHGTLAYMLLRHRDKFPRSAVLMAACFDLGCVVYWLVPTAPPWYAGANGQMPPVRRIMAEAGERFWRASLAPALPFAARQSLCSHALPPLRNLSDGRADPLAGREGSRGGSAGRTR